MEPGKFNRDVSCEWASDGRSMIITRELRYTDQSGLVWKAPAGSVVDGASIPRVCWRVVGSPFIGRYRRASVIHDVYCQTQTRSWQAVNKVFKEMLAVDGVSKTKCHLMAWAVKQFGPRWFVLQRELEED